MTITITGTLKKDTYAEKIFFIWLTAGLDRAMEGGFEIKVGGE